jgi:hypothetical protein
VAPVRYELGFHIPKDDILHSHCRGNLKSYVLAVIAYFSAPLLVNGRLFPWGTSVELSLYKAMEAHKTVGSEVAVRSALRAGFALPHLP